MNDQNFHENLLNAAAHLRLPDAAASHQGDWRPTTRDDGDMIARPSRRRRMFAVLGAGSLMAAAVSIAITLWSFGGRNEVKAAAIFESFRHAVSHAFSLKLTNIVVEGMHVDGEVQIVCPSQDGDTGDPIKAALDLHVRADETATELAGLNADIALGAEPGNEWLYLKMTSLPQDWINEPVAAFFMGMARNGIMLDLNGLLLDQGVSASLFLDKRDEASAEERPAAQSPHRHTLNLGLSMGHSNRPAAPEHGLNVEVLNMGRPGHGDGTADDGAADPAASEGNDSGGHDFDVVEDWLSGLFTGNLTAEQMAAMVSHLEAAARDVSVTDLGDGNFSLLAIGFDHEQVQMSEEDRAILNRLVVEIRYERMEGVQWVELRNVGDAAGTIRFEQLPNGIDAAALDRSRFTQNGSVPTFPVPQLIQMFHGSDADGTESPAP